MARPSTSTRLSDDALNLARCPHCSIANPYLKSVHRFATNNSNQTSARSWRVYVCSKCGGAVLGWAFSDEHPLSEIFPGQEAIQEGLPAKAESFLNQAIECLHSPSGAIMLCASSVDAMLKQKGLKEGSLNKRINDAKAAGLITDEMALWAHDVRLDANNERHADEDAALPTEEDAKKCIDFTKALGLFMYVLPSMVERGRKDAQSRGT